MFCTAAVEGDKIVKAVRCRPDPSLGKAVSMLDGITKLIVNINVHVAITLKLRSHKPLSLSLIPGPGSCKL